MSDSVNQDKDFHLSNLLAKGHSMDDAKDIVAGKKKSVGYGDNLKAVTLKKNEVVGIDPTEPQNPNPKIKKFKKKPDVYVGDKKGTGVIKNTKNPYKQKQPRVLGKETEAVKTKEVVIDPADSTNIAEELFKE